MTWFGKILVLLNLALSLTLATWALAAFTTRVDWSDSKGKEGQPDGEYRLQQTRTKELTDIIPGAETRWRKARETLLALEDGTAAEKNKDSRASTRAWYDAELQCLKTGKIGGADRPQMVAIAFDDRRRPVPDENNYNRPKMLPATDRSTKPLKWLDAYNEEEEDLLTAIDKEMNRLEDATLKDIEYTTQLIGGNKGLAEPKKELEDQKVALVKRLEEELRMIEKQGQGANAGWLQLLEARLKEELNPDKKQLLQRLLARVEKRQKRLKEEVLPAVAKLNDVDNKGLQQRLVEERLKRDMLLTEQPLVKEPLINTYVESELLLKRQRELLRRLDELQKKRAAALAGGK